MKYFLAVFAIINISLLAQDNSLLWEISGNGLTKSSYLYGTIHSSQEKFFDMNDSVFTAMESVESFTGELNMDSLGNVASKLLTSFKPADISKYLNEEEIAKLKEIVKERLGISYEALPVKNPVLIGIMVEGNKFKGTMPFFIDEYLYKIAKARNKNIYGLETVDDQLNLFNQLNDEDIKGMLQSIVSDDSMKSWKLREQLSEAYFNNDLIKLNEIVSTEMKEYQDLESKFLIKRNYTMAAGIAELVKKQSVFTAIGSAHLAGEQGVIELLRKEGFTLRAVKFIKTGMAKKYLEEMLTGSWIEYSPEDGAFTIELPGTPSDLPIPVDSAATKPEAVMFNEASGAVYLVISIPLPGSLDSLQADSLINSVTSSMPELEESSSFKDITFAGINGKELAGKISGYEILFRFLFDDKHFYWLQYSTPGKISDSPNCLHFFNSFKVKTLY